VIVWMNAPRSADTRESRFISALHAYWAQTSGARYLQNSLHAALLKKRAALAAKKAELIDRRGKKSLTLTSSRKSRLQTALISLQNGLVRSQYLLAAKVQACAGPQSV
jgi:hypothetical protein